MEYKSILYPYNLDNEINQTPPVYFKDLNLDKIIDGITLWNKSLSPYYFSPLKNLKTIEFRQELMEEIETKKLFDHIKGFYENIIWTNKRVLKIKSRLERTNKENNFVSKGDLLFTLDSYLESINDFFTKLSAKGIKSEGLTSFLNYLDQYISQDEVRNLDISVHTLIAGFKRISYSLQLSGKTVKVLPDVNQDNAFSSNIVKLFQRFDPEFKTPTKPTKHRRIIFEEHVENSIMNVIASQNKAIFEELNLFTYKYINFIDDKIVRFAQEIQFYIAYIDYMEKFKSVSLPFCYPIITEYSKEIYNFDGYDLALADSFGNKKKAIVCNDFALEKSERIIYISGPNQGGKTTFARAFGQIHYLASLGLPVPGKKAKLLLFDDIFTHFEEEEKIEDLNGRLMKELSKLKKSIDLATDKSIIILNEVLNSTSLVDAIYINKEIMKKIEKLHCLCLNITFMDEIIKSDESSISMVASVVEDSTPKRTYKITRADPNGLAYASYIAKKYDLTYQQIKDRIKK